jgi:hypothetical protein
MSVSEQRVTCPARALPPGVMPLLTTAEAARYLGLSRRHMQDRADIPRVDVSAPGAARPAWRYRVEDLARFAAARVVAPYRAPEATTVR